MPRPPIDQQITFFYTDDLERLSRFYGEVMELEQVLDQGVCHIYRVTDDSFIGVCNKKDRPRGTKGVMFTFIVRDVMEMFEYLKAKGVEFEVPPSLRPGALVYSAFFRDPEGYMLEIQEFRDSRWPYKRR
jgi:catechol 2,3-dioxygenase-like lactoylglutathione lyase family enzyme